MTDSFSELQRIVDTSRFGPFKLTVGVDENAIETALARCIDANKRPQGSPFAPALKQLEKEIVVSSVFGTNTIEGGRLTEAETQLALELEPEEIQEVEQRRATNIKDAYDLAFEASDDPDWQLDRNFVFEVHSKITSRIPHERNQPGLIRNNPKDFVTYVGDARHGGQYKPPQFGGDIRKLLDSLLEWHTELVEREVPALVRAALVHFYFELIHPFWDGNGRVGRVLEATLLQHAGFRYAPFKLARYYLANIDQYFTLFNSCRKAASKGQRFPNTGFLSFFLEGMRQSLEDLQNKVNLAVQVMLFDAAVRNLHESRVINARQLAIVTHIIQAGRLSPKALRDTPWYSALYARLSDKTKQRDLKKLTDSGLLVVDQDSNFMAGWMELGHQR